MELTTGTRHGPDGRMLFPIVNVHARMGEWATPEFFDHDLSNRTRFVVPELPIPSTTSTFPVWFRFRLQVAFSSPPNPREFGRASLDRRSIRFFFLLVGGCGTGTKKESRGGRCCSCGAGSVVLTLCVRGSESVWEILRRPGSGLKSKPTEERVRISGTAGEAPAHGGCHAGAGNVQSRCPCYSTQYASRVRAMVTHYELRTCLARWSTTGCRSAQIVDRSLYYYY